VATTDPWPSEADLERAYAGWYRPPAGRFSAVGDAVLRRTRSSLANRLDRIAPPGPVLDVGAGDGTLLDALRHRGRKAVGLERRSDRADALEADIQDLSDAGWATIVFWHSLEHLSRPATAIETAAALLAADGVLIAAVPNSDSIQARLFGDRWFALDLPRHLVHLTSEALLLRLQALGLRIERVSYVRGGQVTFGWLHGILAALPGHLDLYDAIRRPEARSRRLSAPIVGITLVAAALLLPLAFVAAVVEVLARRGGTVYLEARKAPAASSGGDGH
jgi:SAM-dependent methyltransferase